MDDAINPRWDAFRELPNHPEMSVFPDRPPRVQHQDAGDAFEFTCPKCKYDLRGIAGTYCPECGIALEYEPVTVFTAADLSLAWAAALVLDQQEITNMIVTGSFDPIVGLFSRTSSLPHVMVPFKFFHEAIADLDEAFGKREFKQGEQPTRPIETPPWTCPGCSEENPGSFELCWSCGEAISRDRSAGRNDSSQ